MHLYLHNQLPLSLHSPASTFLQHLSLVGFTICYFAEWFLRSLLVMSHSIEVITNPVEVIAGPLNIPQKTTCLNWLSSQMYDKNV